MTEQLERSFIRWSLITFLAICSLAVILVASAIEYAVNEIPAHIDKNIDLVREDLSVYVQALRGDLAGQTFQAESLLNEQVNAIREDLNAQLNVTRADLMLRLDNLSTSVDANLLRANASVATLSVASAGSLSESAMALDKLQADLRDVKEDLHANWIGDKSMGYSRFLATTGELNRTLDAGRRMAEEGAKAAPALAEDVKQDSDNFATMLDVAREYVAPKEPPKKHWYTKFLPQVAVIAGKILF